MTGSATHPAPGPRRATGFTLIEVLAAVFLTSIVISVALTFFVTLSRSTEAAAMRTRDGRHAFAVLDRVARDLEGAYLLAKPAETDPLAHPWLFLAESAASTDGADRLKFTSRNYRPRNPLAHGSDLGVITYLLHASEDGNGYELLRSITPGLPESLDREFPSAEDERFMLVAEGLSHFAMRFLTEDGEWQGVWDSSLLEESSTLPRAAEIELAFVAATPDEEPSIDDFTFAGEPEASEPFTRRVAIPMKAVDLQAMLDEAADGEGEGAEEEEDEYSDEYEDGEEGEQGEAGDGGAEALLESIGEQIPSTGNDPITGGPPPAGALGPEFDGGTR